MTQLTITAAIEATEQFLLDWHGYPVKVCNEHSVIRAFATHVERARQAESDRWAKAMREAVRRGYVTIESDDKCAHGVYTCDDCIECYNEAIFAAIDATQANGGSS